MRKLIHEICLLFFASFFTQLTVLAPGKSLAHEKAGKWYDKHNWIVGCNYIPSTAINIKGIIV